MKIKSFILIIGSLLICAISSIATYFGLSSAGIIKGDKIDLIYSLKDYSAEYNGETITANEDICPFELIEGKLLNGHSEYFVYSGSLQNVGETKVHASVKILDKDGYDVSNEYTIRVNPSKLTITEREILVAIDSTKIEYSGSDIIAGDNLIVITKGALAQGDRIVPSLSFNEDRTGIDVDAKVYDVFGTNKTNNYKISFDENNSSVELARLPLLIEPISTSKVYDGEPLNFSEYRIKNGTLLTGHHLEIDYGDGIVNVDESGTNYKIRNAYVFDENGTNVSDMYNIDIKSTANLTIRPVTIPVKVNALQKTYDGNGFNSDQIAKDKIFSSSIPDDLKENGFYIELTNYNNIVDILSGYSSVNRSEFNCKFELKNDKFIVNSSNYNIEVTNNTYEVVPCVVHIVFKDLGTLEYQSEGLDIDSPLDVITNFFLENNSSAQANDEFNNLTIAFEDENNAISYFKNLSSIGDHFYTVNLALLDKNGNKNNNFRIVYDNRGRIIITKIKMNIVGLSGELQYNGEEQSLTVDESGKSYETYSGNLLNGHEIKITYNDKLKSIGTKVCSNSVYKIVEKTGLKRDVTDQYYDINFIPGELTIVPKEITVMYNGSSNEVELTYGDSINLSNYMPLYSTGWIKGEKISVRYAPTSNYEQFDPVGVYNVFYSGAIASNDDQQYILENYVFNYVPLVLNVVQKEVELNWGNINLTYNGKVQKPTCEVKGIFDHDECFLITSEGNINACETGTNYEVEAIRLSNSNYKLPLETKKTYVINKVELVLKANDNTIVFGEEAKHNGYTITGFVNGEDESYIENLSSLSYSYSTNPDPFEPRDIVITENPDLKLTATNYSFKPFLKGTLYTIKTSLKVKLNNAELEYGEDLTPEKLAEYYENGQLVITGFKEESHKDMIDFASASYISNYAPGKAIGSYRVTLQNLTANIGEFSYYDFEYIESTITVNTRKIQVMYQNFNPNNITYSGKNLTIQGTNFTTGPKELFINDSFKTLNLDNVFTLNSNSYSVKPVIIDNNGNDVTNNYEMDTAALTIQTSSGITPLVVNVEYVIKQFTYYDGIFDLFSNPTYGNKLVKINSELAPGDRIASYSAILTESTDETAVGVVIYNLLLVDLIIVNENGEEIQDRYYETPGDPIIGKIIITNCPSS